MRIHSPLLVASALAIALSLGLGKTTQAMGTDDYMGSVGLFTGDFCPRGTTEARGQLLPISSNTALFSLLGTTYGGDGRTTFGLPDLAKKAPLKGMRYCITTRGIYPSRP